MSEQKKTIFSGIQPSGKLQIGNYFGAVRNWVAMQEEYHCLYCVVDMHAITVRQEPAVLRRNTREVYAQLLACGLDPEKNTIYVQSHVSQHAELAWVLGCYTMFGELSRMTQFKDKSARYSDNINAGLFSYPSLMAADILLFQSDFVPVGEDQKQHIELTRDVAQRFNGIYGDVFTMPEPYIPKVGARVMSLSDPTRKMSKSDENANGCVYILDTPDDIMRKFRRAVTDSDAQVRYAAEKPGVSNLMSIYALCTGRDFAAIEREFEGRGYGDFKPAVAEALIEKLRPIREETERLLKDAAHLDALMAQGAGRARALAGRTMDKVYKKIGFLPREKGR